MFQDINLGLLRDKKFAYLPTALGGYGKPVPFGFEPNFEAFCVRYKQGTHAGLARELVRRTNLRMREYTVEHRYNHDVVLSAVSRLQSSWHDWIKGKSLYAPTCWLDAPPEVAKYRVRKHGTDVRIDSALRRLQAQGYLVTENDLAIAYEHNQLCSFLLNADTHEQFMAKREESRKQWLNLSTFSMRLYGLIQPLIPDQNLASPLKPEEYGLFWVNVTHRKLNLRSFLRQENFYDRKAKDAVYAKGPMKVKVPLNAKVTVEGRRYWFENQTDRLDDVETTEEFDLLYDWIRGDPENTNPPSRRIVDDDAFVIKEIQMGNSDDAYCIVTDDVALCREAYGSTKQWICRVPVKWYYMSLYYGEGDSPWEKDLKERYPFFNWRTIEDTGSIESYEEIGFRDGLPIKWARECPLSMTQPSIKGNKRIRARPTTVATEDNPSYRPYGFPTGYLFSPGHFLNRKNHPHRRGWA